VPSHYRPLRLNVGFLLNQTTGYSRTFDFQEEHLALGTDLKVESFEGHLVMLRTPQGVVGKGEFTAKLPAICVRCAKDFFQIVPVDIEDLFVYPPPNPIDPLLVVGEDAFINLEPIMREYIMVNQPTRALCREDCLGLCPICGNDLNEGPCSHPEESHVQPAPLHRMKEEKKN
jgi:uncharacterized protein